MLRMHGGHPVSCLCCANLELATNTDGYCYSDPGADGSLICKAGVFAEVKEGNEYAKGYCPDVVVLHDIAGLAQGCEKFAARVEGGTR